MYLRAIDDRMVVAKRLLSRQYEKILSTAPNTSIHKAGTAMAGLVVQHVFVHANFVKYSLNGFHDALCMQGTPASPLNSSSATGHLI